MQGSNSGSVRSLALLEWISDELTVLAEAFGEPLTEQRQEIYCSGLVDISQDQLRVGFRRARYELKWFPKLAELRELAGALPEEHRDGRPGPEEAWAKMPKGERIEADSVVWCEEERMAYSACRSLLADGDQIGARMAFKERYLKEVAEARALRRPIQWSLSAGYDVEHRLATLANAVQDSRLTLERALDFVPGERRSDFAQMLPPAQTKGLLTGNVSNLAKLPGLPGVLAKLQMEGTVPAGLDQDLPRIRTAPTERSPEEWRELRERARAQLESIKNRRGGTGGDSV